MAITGIMLLGFVLADMIGNLKVYLGEEGPQQLTPNGCATSVSQRSHEPSCCGALRIGLIALFVIHIVAAAQSSTRMNHKARPEKYKAPRDYVAANFASRTMRWSGVIVASVHHLPPPRPHLGHRQTPTSTGVRSTRT